MAAVPDWTDLRDPRQLSLAFRKLAWSMDDTLSFWWLRGVRYGMRGAVATPFFDMHVGLWFRTRDIGNDRYEVLRASANFYTPVGEASLLEQFANPFTGRCCRCATRHHDWPSRPTTWMVVAQRAEATPGVNGTTASSIGPAWLGG